MQLARVMLRSVLVTYLWEACGDPVTVQDLVERLHTDGFTTDGRSSKVISDSLRTEIGWGRVARAGRGRYRALSGVPKTTRWRIQQRVALMHEHKQLGLDQWGYPHDPPRAA